MLMAAFASCCCPSFIGLPLLGFIYRSSRSKFAATMKVIPANLLVALFFFAKAQAFSSSPRRFVRSTTTSLNLESLEQKTPGEKEVSFLLDTYGEKARFYRRDVFSASDWIQSRRSNRFIETLLSTNKSALLRQLSIELFFITIIHY